MRTDYEPIHIHPLARYAAVRQCETVISSVSIDRSELARRLDRWASEQNDDATVEGWWRRFHHELAREVSRMELERLNEVGGE